MAIRYDNMKKIWQQDTRSMMYDIVQLHPIPRIPISNHTIPTTKKVAENRLVLRMTIKKKGKNEP